MRAAKNSFKIRDIKAQLFAWIYRAAPPSRQDSRRIAAINIWMDPFWDSIVAASLGLTKVIRHRATRIALTCLCLRKDSARQYVFRLDQDQILDRERPAEAGEEALGLPEPHPVERVADRPTIGEMRLGPAPLDIAAQGR